MTNSKTTKRALLTSVMALVLCFAMLTGTTFAWFTDTETSANNRIVAGNLDIDLLMYNAGATTPAYVSIANTEEENLLKIFSETKDGVWEPGKTEIVYLAVQNLGNLALKYNIIVDITDEGLKDALEYAIVDGLKYGDLPTDVTTWAAVKELAQVGDMKDIVDNKIIAAENGVLDEVLKGYDAANPETEYFALAIHMKEEAGNEFKSTSVGINVTLVATQVEAEADAFSNDYDKNAGYDIPWDGETVTDPVADENGVYHITTAAELVGLMDVTGNSIFIGETIVLENNIDLGGKTVYGIGGPSGQSNFAGTFDGQGFTISNFKIDATDREYYAGLFNNVGNCGTVKNLTVKNATVIGTSQVGAVAGGVNGGPNDSSSTIDNCKAIDCTVIGVKKVGAVVGYCMGSTATNNYAENCTVVYSEKEGGAVLGFENEGTGCTVENNTDRNVTVTKGTLVSTAAELKDAIKNGGNVVLVNNIVMNESIATTDVEFVLDGSGHTITMADDVTNNIALFDITRGSATIKNVTFDGIKDGAVVRTVGAGFNMDNVTIKNCNHTVQQGLLRLLGNSTITNSTFVDNTCTILITQGYDTDDDNCAMKVEKCVFENNTCNSTAVIYYAHGNKAIIDGNKFVENKVTSTGNAATLYMGCDKGNVITNNVFKNNTVATQNSQNRAAGALVVGASDADITPVITNNAFVDNTATGSANTANEVWAKTTGGDIKLSGNYWGGSAPVENDYYNETSDNSYKVIIENYLTTYGN